MSKKDLIFHIGCAGWSYNEWKKGGFYPKKLQSQNFLSYYSKFFDFTEINTSFYNIPSRMNIEKWKSQTPSDFRFVAKIWQNISHKIHHNPNLDKEIRLFFSTFEPLKSKLSAFLLQFPPSFHNTKKNHKKINYLFNNFPKWGKYVIEFRHKSWFLSSIIDEIVDNSNLTLCTSFVPYVQPNFLQQEPFQYFRMIGDRVLTRFDHVQRPQIKSMKLLLDFIKKSKDNPTLEEIFVIFNNHFRGFAPENINELKQLLNLSFKSYRKDKNLLDYF